MRASNNQRGRRTYTQEQEPEDRFRCATPKDQALDKQRNLDHISQQQQHKTQVKQPNYLHRLPSARQQVQLQLGQKLQNYQVVARTLQQYYQQHKCQQGRKQLLSTMINIIKAYARAQIKQTSPSVSQLVHRVLDTLPIAKRGRAKHSKQQKRTSKKRQQSKHFVRNAKPRRQIQEHLVQQIQALQQKLQQLHSQNQQARLLSQQIKSIPESQLQQYILQLEQTVEAQQQTLAQLDNQF